MGVLFTKHMSFTITLNVVSNEGQVETKSTKIARKNINGNSLAEALVTMGAQNDQVIKARLISVQDPMMNTWAWFPYFKTTPEKLRTINMDEFIKMLEDVDMKKNRVIFMEYDFCIIPQGKIPKTKQVKELCRKYGACKDEDAAEKWERLTSPNQTTYLSPFIVRNTKVQESESPVTA